jgi:hypothetical protein
MAWGSFPLGDLFADVGFELDDTAVRWSAQLPVGELGEPALDQGVIQLELTTRPASAARHRSAQRHQFQAGHRQSVSSKAELLTQDNSDPAGKVTATAADQALPVTPIGTINPENSMSISWPNPQVSDAKYLATYRLRARHRRK